MKTLTLISNILIAFLMVYYTWLLVCDLVGAFTRKKHFPPAEPSHFAVLVCARNEEQVLGALLDSFSRQDYPQDQITTFVVAHNCSDRTAEVAREHGAVVWERTAPWETHKGDALRYGINQIRTQYPGVFDAVCIFDADNLADRNYLREINNALASGADVVQGFRDSKNYHRNAVTELFGAYWYQIMICQNLPHTAMGLPATVGGTGFAVRMSALDEGWNTHTILEDVEFTVQMTLKGKRCILAPCAVFYDEQPVSWKVGMQQRYRWSAGAYQVLRLYLPRLLRAVKTQGAPAVKMIIDLLINPVMLLSLAGFILQGVISALTGGTASFLWYLILSAVLTWGGILPMTLILFLHERMKPWQNVNTLLFFPFFLLISMIFCAAALFDPNPKWTPIPHTDTTNIEALET